MKIFLDAGHNFQGADTGAEGNGLREQDITFIIANKLKELFIKGGHSVKMSRERLESSIGKTLNESLKKRCDMSNEWGADLFISIHCNAYNGKACGTETYVYSLGTKAEEYAKKVQSAIVGKLGTADRGVKSSPELFVLSKTKAPAMLVETAFIDNLEDSHLLINRTDGFASSIYEGVTGEDTTKETGELTTVNDIVYYLNARGIISDAALWTKKLTEDTNSYWLARKTVNYMRKAGV